MDDKAKLLFLVTEDCYFYSHRLPLAKEAVNRGFEVVVATRVQQHDRIIEAHGCRVVPLRLRRRSWNPLREIAALLEIVRIYRREQPDIVHHVALKPVVYGTIAARIARVRRVTNAITGLGFVFSSETMKAKVLRPVIKWLLKILLNRTNIRTILQNPDDQNMLIQEGIVRRQFTKLIRGSGVDPQKYFPVSEQAGIVTIVLASRMLWDKGIKEFVEAARILKADGIDARFVLVGDTDDGNFAAVPAAQLDAWNKSGIVEWWGKRSNMMEVFASAHIVCLPSAYGEGVPKVLIEAAACGRPIVTTDAPGCREIVRHGENGLLVPVRDVPALAAALRHLIDNPDTRRKMGEQGRRLAEQEFSVVKVIQETFAVYDELMP